MGMEDALGKVYAAWLTDEVASKRRRGDVPSLQRLSDGRRWPGQLM
jgi:hypothetical protein